MNALRRALETVPASTAGLAVGYSGGLDSTVLLHALRATHPNRPLRALHVCHHLQPDAERWAADCARQCAAWGVSFTRLDVVVDPAGQGVEAAARAVRYAAVRDELAANETFVTAHHAEDQAETFLLQALRGAGVRGLAAMPGLRALGAGRHWRPWLEVERAAIRDYADRQGLGWIEDPSNQDPAVARGYLRADVWPALAARWPAAARTLARSARHAAAAERAVAALAAIDHERAGRADDALDVSALETLDRDRQRALLRHWLAEGGHDRPDHRHVDRILALPGARLAASPCIAFADTEVRFFRGALFAMQRLPAAPDGRLRWNVRKPLVLPANSGRLELRPRPQKAALLDVSFRDGGERVETDDGSHRNLKDILRERRVAPWLRARVPLVYHEDTLVAVGDVWRHPRADALLALSNAHFVWRDAPSGAGARVVEAPAFG